MDNFTRQTSFKQWLSPTIQTLLEEQVNMYQLDHYTKKLHMNSFMSLLLYTQLHETENGSIESKLMFETYKTFQVRSSNRSVSV